MNELIPTRKWELKNAVVDEEGTIISNVKPLSSSSNSLRKNSNSTALSREDSLKKAVAIIKINGQEAKVTAGELMRAIRYITQTIGEHKNSGNIYSQYLIPSMRKARSDIAADLAHYFHLNFEIDENTGKCRFF